MSYFYLVNGTNIKNVKNILETGILKPGGGYGLSTNKDEKSDKLYFELIFSGYKRNNFFPIGIYYSIDLLKDFDFNYEEEWRHKNSKLMKFPKTNILKTLNKLRNDYLIKKKKMIINKGELPFSSYEFTTTSEIPIHKYMLFISNPKFYLKNQKVKTHNNKQEMELNKILKEKYPKIKLLNYYDKHITEYNDYPKILQMMNLCDDIDKNLNTYLIMKDKQILLNNDKLLDKILLINIDNIPKNLLIYPYGKLFRIKTKYPNKNKKLDKLLNKLQ